MGHGSYGAVYKAKCDQLPCAAKVLHPTILDPRDPGSRKIIERFSQECAFLESIRHPNIVQYLGMTMDPESRLPVLLMELLDESLTKMLECPQRSLSYCTQVDICHDIALAVAYLHSNDIIHRDLSSNNVLVIAGRRAKVTDFGMSRLAGASPSLTPLTMCPGTLAYMPPEALREPPRYTKKLDCFSEGVIMIQVCTRIWPEPGSRSQLVPDPRSPTGSTEMPVLEAERRKNHIDMIDPTHALLPIAMDCLKYQEDDRPSSEELCQRLDCVKKSSCYTDDLKQSDDANDVTSQAEQLLVRNQELQGELLHKDRELEEKVRQLQQQRRIYEDEKRELRIRHQEEISRKERQIQQLNQQLEEQQQVTGDLQQANQALMREIEQLQQPSQHIPKIPNDRPQVPKEWTLTFISWRDGGRAPYKMARGATTIDGNVVYFMGWNGETCSYSSSTRKWSKLQKYPYQGGSLAVINGEFTAIGGCEDLLKKDTYTNKLLSLRGNWAQVFPPMPTKRRATTTVSSMECLIVAGGATGPHFADYIATVEVMDAKHLIWSTVASLPHPYNSTSSTICGDRIYILGGGDSRGKTKSVVICSLMELLRSSPSSSSVWHRIADAPSYFSTCVAVNEDVLLVGGYDENNKAKSAIHKYNTTANSWDFIDNISIARCYSLVAVLPTNEVIAVGGNSSSMNLLNSVEIATFTYIGLD